MVLTKEEIEKRISDSYEVPNRVVEMVERPMVTIRTSTYNHGAYIRECIEGVLMQETEYPFEFIIGEDFSTDGTRETVMEYARKYPEVIRVMTADYNVGAMANGTRCRRASRGKYIALCEGDDYWTDPLKLQKQVDFLEDNPEYVVTYHNADIVDENSEVVKKSRLPESYQRDFSSLELIRAYWILTLTMCFRNVITRTPKEFLNVTNGDTIMTSLLGEHGKGKYLGEQISPARYRVHSGGLWSSKSNLDKNKHSQKTFRQLAKYHSARGDRDSFIYFRDLSESLRKKIRLEEGRSEDSPFHLAAANCLLHFRKLNLTRRIKQIITTVISHRK